MALIVLKLVASVAAVLVLCVAAIELVNWLAQKAIERTERKRG